MVSPDGELHFVSFATLIDAQNRFLVEQYEIGYVASGRDLAKTYNARGSGIELFGNPAFEKPQPESPYMSREPLFRSRLSDSDRSACQRLQFRGLPQTQWEVESIAGLFESENEQPEVHLGAQATEWELKNISSPRLLHLATHGFYLHDVAGPSAGPTDTSTHWNSLKWGGLGRSLMDSHPMHRSGIALAGADLSTQLGSKVASEGEDGIVTAAEIAMLDLAGTELVVLSACDTAIGDLASGEGVMGLRRAFVQAGAKNLLITLWPVEDKETSRLMVDFYRNYLEFGDAVRAICQVQREAAATHRAGSEGLRTWLWGPFLVSVQGGN
jgi:CHAT domain-containing protein